MSVVSKVLIMKNNRFHFLYSLASDERCDIPRFISCFPIFVCCACCWSKLLCDTNCDDSFLLPLDDDVFCSSDGVVKFCCCCLFVLLLLLVLFFVFFSADDFDLQFRRNLVRKFRSGGYDGYYRPPPIRFHPRLFSLLLYQIPEKKNVLGLLNIILWTFFYNCCWVKSTKNPINKLWIKLI